MDAFVMFLPTIVKSHMDNGRRIVEVGASTQEIDHDGDVILQDAILKSASDFIANGHLDLDHKSEFGARLGIANPSSYIVGRPLEVKDTGDNTTSVVGEIARARDGHHDPVKNRYDEFWDTLQSDPPVRWYSSVYGFPTDAEVCKGDDNEHGARRYLIKGMEWRSLAFTRTPKNTAIKNAARIVTAKSFMTALAKGFDPYEDIPLTVNGMADLWDRRFCAKCHIQSEPTTVGYRRHFEKCAGILPGDADVWANAMMNRINVEKALGRFSS